MDQREKEEKYLLIAQQWPLETNASGKHNGKTSMIYFALDGIYYRDHKGDQILKYLFAFLPLKTLKQIKNRTQEHDNILFNSKSS